MKKQEFVQNEKFTSHLSNYLQLYLERCISSLSCNTVRRYYACLKLFDRYLTNIEWNSEKLDIEVFDSWVESLRPRKQSTIILHRTIIIQFLRFLSSLGFEVVMPEKIIDRTDYTPHIFTDHERELFFAKADNYIKTKSDNKYLRVIIPMAMRIIDCCGSREEETLSLKVEDLDFDMGCIAMKRTKGEKQRLVPVTPKLNEMLREYCIHMGIISTPDAYLFPGATADESLDPNIFRNHYRNILFRTDIKIMERGKRDRQGCIHDWRHTFACRSLESLIDKGLDEDDVHPYLSTYLGHENLDSTDRYLKYPTDRMDKDIEKFDSYSDSALHDIPIFNEDISLWTK